MAHAETLAPHIWNALADMVARAAAPVEIVIDKVVKRDTVNKVIWTAQFGDTGIPLAVFGFSFATYDTQPDSTVRKRYDAGGNDDDPAYHVGLIVPRIAQNVVILNPGGAGRFPVCIGVLRSNLGTYWQGE